MSGWKKRIFRTLSRLMRLAVMFAMQPDANLIRALAMSILRRQHRHADRLDADDLDAIDRQHDIEVVNHHVEDDVDVEAALRKAAQPVHFDEPRRAAASAARPAIAGLNRSVWPTASVAPDRFAAASITSASASDDGHRLLDQHVHAALEKRPGDREVIDGRHRDVDGVDAAEQRAVVGRAPRRRRARDRRLRPLGDEIDGARRASTPGIAASSRA